MLQSWESSIELSAEFHFAYPSIPRSFSRLPTSKMDAGLALFGANIFFKQVSFHLFILLGSYFPFRLVFFFFRDV